jgi:hypothetical protein
MRKFPRPSHTSPIGSGGSLSTIFIILCIFCPLFALAFLPIFLFIDSIIGEQDFDNLIQCIVEKYFIKFMMVSLPVLLLLNFIQDGIVETVEENSKELCLFFILTIVDIIYVIVKLGSRKGKELPKNDDSLEDKDDFNIE